MEKGATADCLGVDRHDDEVAPREAEGVVLRERRDARIATIAPARRRRLADVAGVIAHGVSGNYCEHVATAVPW